MKHIHTSIKPESRQNSSHSVGQTVYFDCYSGISGDMVLGAMVDAGVPFDELKTALTALPIDGYEITCRHVQRCGIGASQVQVRLTDHDHENHGNEEPQKHEHNHHHDHPHEHGHHHDHSHDHHHTHSHAPHRGFSDIRAIIETSTFSDSVKQRAIEAFRRIAVEEAAVHETTIEAVHFHEVGAVDAIVDIVGAMWCIERLGITRVLSSPIAVGSGTVHAAHGEMPVPAPATARLLAGVPISTGPVTGELATPTGAAIITTLAEKFGPLENFVTEKVAYGAGSREYPTHTNYLRILLGQVQAPAESAAADLPLIRESLTVITAEIDDMPAELLGAALESIMSAGALDCHFIPVQMKKNRPAVSVHVLADSTRINDLLPVIFRQTTTLGIKLIPVERLSLHRRMETVNTAYGDVRVKLALWGEEVLRSAPEFEDCRALAEKNGVPVFDVFNAAGVAAAGLAELIKGNPKP